MMVCGECVQLGESHSQNLSKLFMDVNFRHSLAPISSDELSDSFIITHLAHSTSSTCPGSMGLIVNCIGNIYTYASR